MPPTPPLDTGFFFNIIDPDMAEPGFCINKTCAPAEAKTTPTTFHSLMASHELAFGE